MWDNIFYFIMVPMVYLAFATLAIGIVFKLIVVLLSPGIKAKLGVFPRRVPRPIGVLKDSFLILPAFKKDKVFWLFILVFHIAFLFLFIGICI